MLAAHKTNQDRKPAEAKSERADSALDKKPPPENNPIWQRLALRPVTVQPKLAVSQPNDPSEQEADSIADRVMRMAAPIANNFALSVSAYASDKAQRQCISCEEEEKLQREKRMTGSDSTGVVSSLVYQALSTPGQPLDSATRAFMEPRFGYDLSAVRVHDDAQAAASAEALNANAYTLGSDIIFAAGAFSPKTAMGQRLLAHELAHTAQQRGSPAAPRMMTQVRGHDNAAEREADAVAVGMEHASALSPKESASVTIQLDPKPKPKPQAPAKPAAPAQPKVPVTVSNVDDLYGPLTEELANEVFQAYGSPLDGKGKELITAFTAKGLSGWLGLAIIMQESSFANKDNNPSIDERNVANPFSVHFNTDIKKWPKGCGKNLLLIAEAGKEYTPGKEVKKDCAAKEFRLPTFTESAQASAKTMARLSTTKGGIDSYREEGGYTKDLNARLKNILNKIKLNPK